MGNVWVKIEGTIKPNNNLNKKLKYGPTYPYLTILPWRIKWDK